MLLCYQEFLEYLNLVEGQFKVDIKDSRISGPMREPPSTIPVQQMALEVHVDDHDDR